MREFFCIFQGCASRIDVNGGVLLVIVSYGLLIETMSLSVVEIGNHDCLNCLYNCSWLCCYMCQMNPLIGPVIKQHVALVMQQEWVK